MSTLTKILIVLLTISSIFLCGIVVTYVGTATNYKKELSKRASEMTTLRLDKEDLQTKVNSLNDLISKTAAANSNTTDALNAEIEQVNTELRQAKIDLKEAQTRKANYETILADNTTTLEVNNQLVKDAQAKVVELEALKTKNENEIKDLTNAIVSKDAVLNQYEAEKKRLVEANTQLQNRVDQYLQQVGKISGAPAAVTAMPDSARMAPPVRNLALEGTVNEVKPNDSLVSISIGSANGVKQGMIFHVVRNDKFICDIVIFSVDADQASGYLDLVGENLPRAGDIVKTNF